MKWEALISTYNLKLAWRRINTGMNLQYKRFFRDAYLTYESAADKHIKQLHAELKAKAWQPSYATRLYIPKPSGLQRPISLLGIEDQILLQAIANLFAKKLYAKRQHVESKTVFSSKLTNPKNSIFFMDRWEKTYQDFMNKCFDVCLRGCTWSAHFDLSAFYDTISHDLLLSIESPNGGDPDTQEVIKKWLQTWSAEGEKTMTGHGIPQGPIASAFLAEAFFLPIDFRLQKESFQYLRYVDDIRLFGREENDVRKAAILLEKECCERGLIPQSSKFEIRKLKTLGEAMEVLPSIPPIDSREATESVVSAEDSLDFLASAIDGRPQKIKDKSRFRYVMYRAPKDTRILKRVLKLLPRHPEYIDEFAAYFQNFGKRRAIARASLNFLETEVPYFYVRGEIWHIIARLAGPTELKHCLPIARRDAKDRARCVALSWGVMHFLIRCEKEGFARIGNRLANEHWISRSLLAPLLSDREFIQKGYAVTLLKGTLMEQLAGARELQKRKITLHALGLRQKQLPEHCKITLRSLGVIRRHQITETDYIKDILTKLYGCHHSSIWRALLGTEYEYALQILLGIQARFPGAYSDWLGSQDSFNDMVIRHYFKFLASKGLSGHSKTVDKNRKLVKYGSLIAKNSPFDTAYPSEAKAFRALHQRRNRLPGSHPYDEKGGAKNRWVTKGERNKFVPQLKNALDGIAKVVQQNV